MKNRGVVLAIILAFGIASIFFLAKNNETIRKKAIVGLDAPAFELKDTQGKTWKTSDLKGKVVFINFWASWCDACKEEKPSIQNLVNAEKANDKFVFISVLFRDDPSKAMEYMKSNGFNFPVLIDNKNIAADYGIRGVPETFVIGKNGTIKEKVVGPIGWESPEVRAVIRKLIADGS